MLTETRWITCNSLDRVGFGLKPGDKLPIESTRSATKSETAAR